MRVYEKFSQQEQEAAGMWVCRGKLRNRKQKNKKERKGQVLSRRVVLFALLIALLSVIPALAVHDAGFVELDANIADDTTPGGTELPTDWGDLFSSGTPGGTPLTLPADATASFFAHDGYFSAGSGGHDGAIADSTHYATGSKDTLNISGWSCELVNNPTDKDDIQHAYGIIFTPASGGRAGHTIVYLALERYANTGAGEVSFWILQDTNVGCVAPGTFTGAHVDGDLLVVSEFTNGGAITSLNVYQWVGSSPGALNTTAVATGVDCDGAAANDDVCGNVNTTSISTPWATQDKSSGANTLATSEFFEMGIDVTALLPTVDACYSRIIAGTRTSPSLTATLKDYAVLSNSLCGSITVIKDTVPDDAQDFAYTTTGSGLSSFSLDDDSNGTLSNTTTFINLSPGAYSVTETLPVTGFDLSSIVCTGDTDGGTTTNTGTGTASIDLDAGENIVCTYTNNKRGSITIIKNTVPDAAQDFGYTTTGGLSPASFTLDDDADGTLSNTQTYTNVPVGTYIVTETLPVAGYTLGSIICSDPDSGTTTTVATGTATIDLDAGESITCTYTNVLNGTITIIKNTVPDDAQDFAYTTTGSGLSSFSLDDDADGTLSNTMAFSGLSNGTYTVTETLPVAGFDLTSLVCTDPTGNTTTNLGTGTVTISLDSGEAVTCTYTNTKRGTIVIIKDTVPNDAQDFAYTTTGSGLSSFSLDDDADGTLSNTQTFTNLQPGSYSVTETLPVSGFDLSSLVCVDPSSGTTTTLATGTASIGLAAGETVTCTYTNTKHGHIIIDKVTNPSGDPQSFAFSPSYSTAFSLTDTDTPNNQEVTSSVYSVAETVPSGWDLTSATCSDGSSVNAIDVSAGETVTCTFTNTKRGTITIIKNTVPDDAQDFAYTTTGSGLSSFSLDDDADGTLSNTQTFTNLVPGSYTVTEGAVSGFNLTGIVCTDPSGGTTTDTATRTASINLAAGETVTCTYTNTKLASIVIIKDAIPNDAQDFSFTNDITGCSPSFNLDDDADGTLSNTNTCNGTLSPGTYTVTEVVPAGWDLTNLVCTDASGGTTTNVGTATASISLAAGETVTCTFTNTKRGTIIVEKQTNPNGDPQLFTFTGDASGNIADNGTITVSNLIPGTYTSTETVPSGWDLTSIVCDDSNSTGNVGTATATFNLDPGEIVKCTFTNRKRGTIVIIKDTMPNDAQDFNYTTTGGLSPATFALDDDADGTLSNTQTYTNVVTGVYTVTETLVPGFTLGSLSCIDPDSGTTTAGATATIDLDPGETITCTYTNNRLGVIKGLKFGDLDADGQPQEAGEPGLSGWTILLFDNSNNLVTTTTTGAGGVYQFIGLNPGTYKICEVNLDPTVFTQSFPTTALMPPCSTNAPNGYTVNVAIGSFITGMDFGNYVCSATGGSGTIEGVKYIDYDGDGNKDSIDPYAAGITITLTGTDVFGNPVSLTTTTNSQGQFSFTGLIPGTYLICEVPPPGYHQTYPRSGDLCSGGAVLGHVVSIGCNTQFVKFANTPDESPLSALSVNRVQAFWTQQGTVRFVAIGQGIQDLSVQVFNLSGKSIYNSGWQPNGFRWEPQEANHLAHGVYLYVAMVRGTNGSLVETRLQKLVLAPAALTNINSHQAAFTGIQLLPLKNGLLFYASGQGIQALDVQVFNPKGHRVYASGWTANGLAWNLQNAGGKPIAKGVYLYAISVRGQGGEIVKTRLQKLVIR